MTDDTDLGTALRERVADEHPDLDRLIGVSTRAGTRMRRRRRLGVSLAVAATVGVVAVGSQLGGGPGTTARDPGPAGQPTASTSTIISALEAAAGQQGVAEREEQARLRAVVRVDAAGWQCGPFADGKAGCTKDGAVVSVHVRDAADHDAYLDPAKADVTRGVHTFVSPVHDRWFVTVAPGVGATQQDVDEVASALVWAH